MAEGTGGSVPRDPAAIGVIAVEGVDRLIAELKARGYTVIGPRRQDGAIVFEEIQSASDLPAGYADGIPRGVGDRAEMLVGDRRRPVVGRISMDQSVVDLGPDGGRPGDRVTIFGGGARGEPTVADWARWSGTIPHDIVTGIGPRVRRVVRQAAQCPHPSGRAS